MTNNFAIAKILCRAPRFSSDYSCAIYEMCMRAQQGQNTFYAADLPGIAGTPSASALMRQMHAMGLIRKTGNKRAVLVGLDRWVYNEEERHYEQVIYKVISVESAEWEITFDPLNALMLMDMLEL